jgi:hypothetical protein
MNLDTGTYSPVGPAGMGIGAATPVNMAFRPADGMLYVDNNSPAGTAGLLRVDPQTGLAVQVGTNDVRGLAFDAADVLYTQDGSNRLATVNPSTGTITSLGGPSLTAYSDLVYNPFNNKLYGVFKDVFTPGLQIHRISLTGTLEQSINTSNSLAGNTFVGAAYFASATRMIISYNSGSQNFLTDVNPATGAASNVRTPAVLPQGLAIPEPASLGILAITPLALARRRRAA